MKAIEQYFHVVLFYYAVQSGSNLEVYGWNPGVWPFRWKLSSSSFMCYVKLFEVYEFIHRLY